MSGFEELLTRHEPAILDHWEERLLAAGLAERGGSVAQRRARNGEALGGIRAALRGPGTAAPLPMAVGMARIELKRPGADRNQAETVLALLLGREAIRDVLAPELDAATLAAHLAELDVAFRRLIALYGQATCSMCQARQEEGRVKVERHLESVLESSQDAIVLCDLDWRVEHWNPGAEGVFGWGGDDVRGGDVSRLFPGAHWADEAREALSAELRAQGHVRVPELALTRKDGAAVWVDASYTLVRGQDDRPLGVWILYRDVTEQRRLLDDRLHAERLALVGAMSAKFAHEIRNPLTSILINLDLLRDSLARPGAGGEAGEAAAAEDAETLGSIAGEVNRIQHVVQDYLRFGRKSQLSREPIVLDDLLRRHLAMLAPELGQREVGLILDLGADGAQVDADEDQLWQCVLNLVRNGMEAMPGGGRLTITTRVEGDRVTCAVADTGVGMSPEVQADMFRPFFSTKRGGTGLGMPFVRQAVTEHGATLACRTEPGRGTTFTIALPALAPAAGDPVTGSLEGAGDGA